MTPIATLTGLNATGNAITGPGYPKYICNGMPVSCLGDLAAGPAPGPVISTMHRADVHRVAARRGFVI